MIKLSVGELRALIKDLPDNMPVHVNDVQAGKYSEHGVDAFECEADEDDPEAAFVIMVGV